MLSTETVKSEVEVVYRIELIEVTINCEFIHSFIHSFIYSISPQGNISKKEKEK